MRHRGHSFQCGKRFHKLSKINGLRVILSALLTLFCLLAELVVSVLGLGFLEISKGLDFESPARNASRNACYR